MALYGGNAGVRDQHLLESAIAQPEATFDGEFLHADLYDMAAAYLFHIADERQLLSPLQGWLGSFVLVSRGCVALHPLAIDGRPCQGLCGAGDM